jgi:hypothetical protein
MESPVNTTVGRKLKVAPQPEVQRRTNSDSNSLTPARRIFRRFVCRLRMPFLILCTSLHFGNRTKPSWNPAPPFRFRHHFLIWWTEDETTVRKSMRPQSVMS